MLFLLCFLVMIASLILVFTSTYDILSGKMNMNFGDSHFALEPSKVRVNFRLNEIVEIPCVIYNYGDTKREYTMAVREIRLVGDNFETMETRQNTLDMDRMTVDSQRQGTFKVKIRNSQRESGEETWIVIKENSDDNIYKEMILRIQYK